VTSEEEHGTNTGGSEDSETQARMLPLLTKGKVRMAWWPGRVAVVGRGKETPCPTEATTEDDMESKRRTCWSSVFWVPREIQN